MTIKVPTVFRDVHDIEIFEGDTVVPTYEPGRKPRSVPADAGRGAVVGFGSRRVYVKFEGDQFYTGPSDFHRIYARDLMVVKTATGVPVSPSTRRTKAQVYRDLTDMWMLEIATPVGEPAQQVTLGRNFLGVPPDDWWETIIDMVDRLLWEAGWRPGGSWQPVTDSKRELDIVSAPHAGAVWEMDPSLPQALAMTDEPEVVTRGVHLAVGHAVNWLADQLEAQYAGPGVVAMLADIRNFAETMDDVEKNA